MKFSCYKNDLVEALAFVAKAVAVKPSTPVLSGIYIKTNGSAQLELQANDLNSGIVTRIPVNVEVPGVAAVSGKRFVEFARNMPDDTITISLGENILTLNSGGANVDLLTMNAEDFPTVKAPDGGISFDIGMSKLATLINKTVFSVAKEIERPIFTGVNFVIEGQNVMSVATNTHRLALLSDTLSEPCPNCSFVVRGDLLKNLLVKLDAKETGKLIQVTKTERAITFMFDDNFVTTRLLEGVFPPHDRVIPKETATQITVDTAEFKRVIDFVALMSRETEYNTVKFDISNYGFEISSNSNDVGNAAQSIEGDMTGDGVEIKFNVNYFTDFLRAFDGKRLKLEFNDKYSPAKLTDPDNPNYIYVVTPVRA